MFAAISAPPQAEGLYGQLNCPCTVSYLLQKQSLMLSFNSAFALWLRLVFASAHVGIRQNVIKEELESILDTGQHAIFEVQVTARINPLLPGAGRGYGPIDVFWFSPRAGKRFLRRHSNSYASFWFFMTVDCFVGCHASSVFFGNTSPKTFAFK